MTVAPPQADRELAFWNSVSASRDPADFKAYLARFPQGIFAELARDRVTCNCGHGRGRHRHGCDIVDLEPPI
jgi:hypothetical protein